MKKTILAVALVFALIFPAFGFGAYMVGVEQLELKQFMYKIQNGDNLTRLAKRFETTIDNLIVVNASFETNDGGCVKSRDLILAGCQMIVPHLVMLESVVEVVNNYEKTLDKKLAEIGQAKDEARVESYVITGISVVSLILVLWLFFAIRSRDDWRDKATENSKTSYKLDQDLANANKLLATVQANLKNAQATIRSYDGFVPGSIVKLKTQNGEEIPFKVTLVGLDTDGNPEVLETECMSNECKTRVKPKNALSHHFQQHEATTEHSFPD